MNERDEHRIATRRRQGLVWFPNHPGWDGLLDALSETAELHGPPDWLVTLLDEWNGRLDFKSAGGNTVSEALETFATVMSSRTCHRCGAPGQTRGYDLVGGAGTLIPTRIETRCEACAAAEPGAALAGDDQDSDRVLTRERQGLGVLPSYPGWTHLLDALSESATRHAPPAWKVTHLDQKMGHLRFTSAGRNAVTRALEGFAMTLSLRTCFECGAPGRRRGYGLIPSEEGARPTRYETGCDRCHTAQVHP